MVPGDWLGPLLLAVYGLDYVAVAFAPCSPGCTGTSPAASTFASAAPGLEGTCATRP